MSKPSPELIETQLITLGATIASKNDLAHPEQQGMPEWQGADVRITSDFAWEPSGMIEGHDLIVRTIHARPLTWLFISLRDAFGSWLNAGNKYGFYGSLAQAAQRHLSENQPESDDAKPLLNTVLAETFRWLEVLRTDGDLPEQPGIIEHRSDAEGRQRRIDLESGESTA